jgi:hypothetical protein
MGRGHRGLAAIAVGCIAVSSTLLTSGGAASGAALPCPLLPADNVWHADISHLPLHAKSPQYVASMGTGGALHSDFGAGMWDGGPIGIPFTTVPGTQPKVNVRFAYADESDPGPYPIPANAPIEGGASSKGDRHVLVVDRDNCVLYELYAAYPNGDGTWRAGSGAVYDLHSDALRPSTWTSADAAGLPILPGLVTYDEVASGHIDHAIRITASATQNTFLWPARHQAGDANTNLPPMGLRLRLKASVDISSYSAADQVILRALKTYGAIVADNGSSWFISGAPDPRWNDDDLHNLGRLHGSDFEAVDESSLMADPNSGRVAGSQPPPPGPTVSIADARKNEGNSSTSRLKFTITLSAAATQNVTVRVATADGTAHAPGDYVAKTATVTIRAGSTSASFSVKIVGDKVVEPNETFTVTLSSPVHATLSRAQATGTVVNDD